MFLSNSDFDSDFPNPVPPLVGSFLETHSSLSCYSTHVYLKLGGYLLKLIVNELGQLFKRRFTFSRDLLKLTVLELAVVLGLQVVERTSGQIEQMTRSLPSHAGLVFVMAVVGLLNEKSVNFEAHNLPNSQK